MSIETRSSALFYSAWRYKDGHVGYLGYSFIEGFIKKKLTTPVYPIHEDVAENLADHLSYHSDLMMFQIEMLARQAVILRESVNLGR